MKKLNKMHTDIFKLKPIIHVYEIEFNLDVVKKTLLNSNTDFFSQTPVMSFDWTKMDIDMDESGQTGKMFKTWVVHFDNMHEKFLPCLKTEILIKEPSVNMNLFATETARIVHITKQVDNYISCDIMLTIWCDYNRGDVLPQLSVKPILSFLPAPIVYDKRNVKTKEPETSNSYSFYPFYNHF